MQAKALTFIFGCIGTRLAITYVAKRLSLDNRKYLAIASLAVSIAFMVLYLFNLRPTGFESSAPGGRLWWNWLRPVHALLFASFAWKSYKKISRSWQILLADTLLGLVVGATRYTIHESI